MFIHISVLITVWKYKTLIFDLNLLIFNLYSILTSLALSPIYFLITIVPFWAFYLLVTDSF